MERLRLQDWAGGRPLWLDEQMIALNIRERTVSELTGALWLDQSAPPGLAATERAAMLAFGVGETALRFVPVTALPSSLPRSGSDGAG